MTEKQKAFSDEIEKQLRKISDANENIDYILDYENGKVTVYDGKKKAFVIEYEKGLQNDLADPLQLPEQGHRRLLMYQLVSKD